METSKEVNKENTEPSPPHEHNWIPVPRFVGRYRCTKCFCFGYRGIARPFSANPNHIYEYRCKKCGRWAVARPHRQWLCAEHYENFKEWHARKTAKAKRLVATGKRRGRLNAALNNSEPTRLR